MQRLRLPALIAVAAVLAWLNLHQPAPEVVQPVRTGSTDSAPASDPLAPSPAPQSGLASTVQQRPPLEAALRDPFAPEIPKAPPAPKLPPPAPVVVQAPPAPQPPPLNLSFAGRLRTPQGQDVVYVLLGDTSLELHPGQVLSNGYRVDAITERAIELSYPPLNYSTRLDLPAVQKYQTR